MAALLAALALTALASPALDNPGVPCVGFYLTTCSVIDLVPDDPGDVTGAVCRRVDCPGK